MNRTQLKVRIKTFFSFFVLLSLISFTASISRADSCTVATQNTADSLSILIDKFKACYQLVVTGAPSADIELAIRQSQFRRGIVETNLYDCYYQCMNPGTCMDVNHSLNGDPNYGNTPKEAISCWGGQ